jgi:UDP-2-acetamido-3-amino-2,3-dideoxy-glucuronate N-acetyltransferase
MPNYYKHPSAIIENDVEIGEGSKIWHFSHIRKGAKIGDNCTIGKDVFIDEEVKIGNHVKIQNGVSVYKGVTLDDYVFVGPNVTFTNDLVPRSEGNWSIMPTRIRHHASIGANTTIICGVIVSEYSMIGAGSALIQDTLPYGLYVGNPARFKNFVDKDGKNLKLVANFKTNDDKLVSDYHDFSNNDDTSKILRLTYEWIIS